MHVLIHPPGTWGLLQIAVNLPMVTNPGDEQMDRLPCRYADYGVQVAGIRRWCFWERSARLGTILRTWYIRTWLFVIGCEYLPPQIFSLLPVPVGRPGQTRSHSAYFTHYLQGRQINILQHGPSKSRNLKKVAMHLFPSLGIAVGKD